MTELNLSFDPSCMDDYDPNSLPVEAAIDIIHQTLAPVAGTERVAIRSALGRVVDGNGNGLAVFVGLVHVYT